MHAHPRWLVPLHLVLLPALLVPGARAWALGGLVLLHSIVAVTLLHPRWSLFGPILSAGPPAGDRVALTFDDGPHPVDTPAILAELARRPGASASFFWVGERMRRHPELAALVRAAGHDVQAHSDTHPWWFSLAPPSRLRRELDEAGATIRAMAGREPRWFRPPMGHEHPALHREARRRGLGIVTWRRRSWDTWAREPGALAERVLRQAGPGAILVLHEALRRRDAEGRSVAVRALPAILSGLEARGLRAVSLPELLGEPRPPAQAPAQAPEPEPPPPTSPSGPAARAR